MKKLAALFLLVGIVAFSVNAQKIQIKKGNLNFLKGVKEINVKYDYSNMGVGKFKNEKDYVDKKVKEHNDKEPGKGDQWKQGWEGARSTRYEPKFEELINKELEKANIKVYQDQNDAKYTLTVVTTFTEPGINVGVYKQPAYCNFKYVFTDDKGKVVAELIQTKVPGSQFMGYDFDAGTRIAESYAKGGKSLGKTMYKIVK